MAVIEWVQYDERVVGENSPIYPDDVTNRPLKQLLTDSDLDSTADFPGFPAEYKGTGSPEGVQVGRPGQLYFREDAPYNLWVKQTGVDTNTGWQSIGAGSGTGDTLVKFNNAGDNIESSIARQTIAPSTIAIVIGATDPASAATETFRTQGGIISKGAGATSTIIGEGPTAAGAAAVAIGYYAVAAGTGSIAIGESATVTATADLHGVAIGRSAIVSGEYSVAVGTAVTASGDSSIAFGNGSLSSGTNTISAGNTANALAADTIAFGRSCFANAIDSIIIGRASFVGTLAVGAIVIGAGASAGQTGQTDLNDSVVIGAGSVLSTVTNIYVALAATVILGPRNLVSSAGGQPNQNNVILGIANVIQNTVGGTNGTNQVIGSNNALNNAQNVSLMGSNITVPSQGSNFICIGSNINIINAPAPVNAIMIGCGIVASTNDSISTCVIIGHGALTNGLTSEKVVIGQAARSDADFTISIGSGAIATATGVIAIGRGASTTFADTFVVGSGAVSTAANQLVFGSTNTGGDFRILILGNRGDETNVAAIDVTWRASNLSTGVGANSAVGNLLIKSGLGLGNAATGGEIQFWTGAPTGSGSTRQTGTKQFAVLKSAGGAAAPNTAWFNVTTGAGAVVGTLTNAPTAGNPTFWLPVQINGATCYIPAWP